MTVHLAEMKIEDYEAVYALWAASEGVCLRPSDSRENIARYLERNPGLSIVARDGEQIIGSLLCGYDGLIGCVHHVAVKPSHRHQSVGRCMLQEALARLSNLGIDRCQIVVSDANTGGREFWKKQGWSDASSKRIMTRNSSPTVVHKRAA